MKTLITLSALLAISACNGIGPKNSSEFASLGALESSQPAESASAPLSEPTQSEPEPAPADEQPEVVILPPPIEDDKPLPPKQDEPQVSLPSKEEDPLPLPPKQEEPAPKPEVSLPSKDEEPLPLPPKQEEPAPEVALPSKEEPAPEKEEAPAANLPDPVVQIEEPAPSACSAPEMNAGSGYGLVAKVFDANGFGNNNTRDQVFTNGAQLGVNAYLPKLNFIAEQLKDAEGNAIKGISGSDLQSNYGLLMETQIVLRPEDQEGLYQFAALNNDSIEVTVINGPDFMVSPPANTTNKLTCALAKGKDLLQVEMKHGKALSLRIRFTKVSKDPVALVMLMRRVKSLDGTALMDPQEKKCNSAQNKVDDLFTRNWKLLDHKNFIQKDAPCDRSANLEQISISKGK